MKLLLAISLVAGTALSSGLGAQTTLTLSPSADTYVRDDTPSANYGSSRDVWFGRGSFFSLGVVRTLLYFDLGLVPPDPRQVRSATFSAYQHATEPAAGGIDCELHTITSTWSETAVTWSNQPPYDSKVWSSARVGDSFYQGWIDWDVTDLVRDQASGALANDGWLFRVPFETAGISRLGYFYSRENSATASPRPRLEVETYELLLDVTPLTAGQSGTATVTGATPGGAVILTYGTSGLGTTTVPQLGVDLEILSPVLAASGRANAAGAFTVTRVVPPIAAGRSGHLQAAAQGQLSNLVAVTVQ